MRERGGGLVCVLGEPEQPEQVVGPPCRDTLRGAYAERRDLDVLPHREAAEGVTVLERPREPFPPAPEGRPTRHVPLLEQHAAARGTVEAAEDVDERRLARAVRADQADDLALPKLE